MNILWNILALPFTIIITTVAALAFVAQKIFDAITNQVGTIIKWY